MIHVFFPVPRGAELSVRHALCAFRPWLIEILVSRGWVELSDERIEVRIERGLAADGQLARQATARPRSVSMLWAECGS
jgi:hypothetical protein